MGCCVSHRADPIDLEVVFKSEAELFSRTAGQDDVFCDVTLESQSQKSLAQSEVQSPMPSFGFLTVGREQFYFADRVLKQASKDNSFLDRSGLTSTRDESNLSLTVTRPGTGHIRFISADAYFARGRKHSTAATPLNLSVLLRENYPCKGDSSLATPMGVSHKGSFSSGAEEEFSADLNVSLGDEELRGREDPRMWH